MTPASSTPLATLKFAASAFVLSMSPLMAPALVLMVSLPLFLMLPVKLTALDPSPRVSVPVFAMSPVRVVFSRVNSPLFVTSPVRAPSVRVRVPLSLFVTSPVRVPAVRVNSPAFATSPVSFPALSSAAPPFSIVIIGAASEPSAASAPVSSPEP